MVKNLLPMREVPILSLGQKDTLEKALAIHSRILAQTILWREEPGRLLFMESQRVRTTEQLTFSLRQTLGFEVCCCYFCCRCITSVVSDSVRPHRQQPTRLHRPWDSTGKNTGVGCHRLLHLKYNLSQIRTLLIAPMDGSLLIIQFLYPESL